MSKIHKNNNQQNKKPFKKFTLRLKNKTYFKLKAIQKLNKKNPISPFLSLNALMNKGLKYKYSNSLLRYLKRYIITEDEYHQLDERYFSVLKEMEKLQWFLSNIANNDNQIARDLNTIHDQNVEILGTNNVVDSLKYVNERTISKRLAKDRTYEDELNKKWNHLISK